MRCQCAVYQITRCHAPGSNKINSEKGNYNSELFTINFVSYNGICISLIAANW